MATERAVADVHGAGRVVDEGLESLMVFIVSARRSAVVIRAELATRTGLERSVETGALVLVLVRGTGVRRRLVLTVARAASRRAWRDAFMLLAAELSC